MLLLKQFPSLPFLENKTIEFVNAFCSSDLPEAVKEAALFNISTLRTQTCFRISDGNFFAWEGCNDKAGVASEPVLMSGTMKLPQPSFLATWQELKGI